MKKGVLKRITVIMCAVLVNLNILAANMPAFAANNDAQVFLATQEPGFSYGQNASDYVPNTGKDYYVLKNKKIQIGVTNFSDKNNLAGSLTPGALTDMVDLSCNRENVDWGGMYLNSTMDDAWDKVQSRSLDLSNVSVDGTAIKAKGSYRANQDIKGELVYSLVDDNAGVVRMDLKLTNTGASEYNGYFEYLFDPDEAGEQVSYTPGIGYSTSSSPLRTSGWDKNYLFNGPKDKVTGNTAHTIIWPKDQQPAALASEGYISGAWFNADMAAGASKTITFYHAVTVPKDASAPYMEAEALAEAISNGVDLNNYTVLSGRINDEVTNSSVSGVNVVAKYAVGDKQGQIGGTALTNASGNYSMLIEKDVYTLTASTLGYEQQSASIDLTKVEPILDIPLQTLPGARISKDISLGKWGTLVESGSADYIMENNKIAASIADNKRDSQIPFSRGRILDMSAKSIGSDGLDWIYTSWISENEPVENDGNDTTNEGDQWNKTNTRFDTLEVTKNETSSAELKAEGVYAADLFTNPDAKQAELTQVMKIDNNSDYISVTTTLKNTSGSALQVFAGDVLDLDLGSQASYIPGVGKLTNEYAKPIIISPSQPWVAQFTDGGAKQVYAMIYDNNNIKAFGSVNWVGAYTPVNIAPGENYTYTRKMFVADSSMFANYWEAVSAFLTRHEQGWDASFRFDDRVYATGEYVPFYITVKNTSENEINNLKYSLELPCQLVSAESGEVTFGSIAAGETKEFEVKARAVEAGRGIAKVNVIPESGVPLSFAKPISISGEGWYGGDDHSHTTYSDGSGSIKNNTDSAYSKGLSWLYSTDHNSIRQYPDTQKVTTDSRGDFVSIAGNELSSNIGHALGYSIPYADTSVYRVSGLTKIASATEGQRTWQNVINEVNNDGGMFFVAHPNYPGLQFPDIYDIRNFAGIEVWNGFYHALDNVNTVAFKYWDEINSRGEKKYYGIANSDGHNSAKIGDPYIMMHMPTLSITNVNTYIREGNYYGTNGPQLRFDINGIDMGKVLKVSRDGETARITLRAFDPLYNLTGVTLYKNTVTGSAVLNREIVNTWDLNGQNLKEWSKVLDLPVKNGEFYRIEVKSEKGTTGNGGKGIGSGTGFAYSNPIWIETNGSNSVGISNITYINDTDSILKTGIAGNYYITANPSDVISAEKLSVTAPAGANVTKSFDEGADVLNVIVTSADESNSKNYKVYVIRSERVPKFLSGDLISAIPNETYSGGAITPAITVKDGETTLTENTDYTVAFSNNTNVGTATVNVTFTGSYAGTATKTFTINQRQITLTLSASPQGSANAGSSVTLTAQIANAVNLPAGTVTFKYGDTVIASGVAVTNEGGVYKAQTTWSNVPEGSHTITAEYIPVSGDNYTATQAASLSDYSITKQNQTGFGFSASEIAKTYGDNAFAVSATGGQSTGAVTYTVTSGTGIISINGSNVTVLKAGTAVITATKAADSAYNAAEATITINVSKAQTTIKTLPKASDIAVVGKLSDSSLSGGEGSVAGSFAWSNPETVISATGKYEVTFIPADTANYLPSKAMVDVKVTDDIKNSNENVTFDLSNVTLPSGVTSVRSAASVINRTGSGNSAYDDVNRLINSKPELGSLKNLVVCDLNLLDQNGNAVTGFTGKIKVKIPVPEGMSGDLHIFWYNSQTGTLSDMGATQENGYLVFETTHFSYYAVAQLSAKSSNPNTGDNRYFVLIWVMLIAVTALICVRFRKNILRGIINR